MSWEGDEGGGDEGGVRTITAGDSNTDGKDRGEEAKDDYIAQTHIKYRWEKDHRSHKGHKGANQLQHTKAVMRRDEREDQIRWDRRREHKIR